MKQPPESYGDNFPTVQGLYWDPRLPWRHGHVTPDPSTLVWRVGWWTVVLVLMGFLVVLVARDGFSEPARSTRADVGELVIRFHDGVLRYPDGAVSALTHQVEFIPLSLRRLNTRFGLIAVERLVDPTQLTHRAFKLVFASRAGLERALAAYRHDPHVIWADLARAAHAPHTLPSRSSSLYTRDA